LVQGTCIVNEAMLSGESTPLLKESIELLDSNDKLDADGQHKNAVLFSGTKLLQGSNGGMWIYVRFYSPYPCVSVQVTLLMAVVLVLSYALDSVLLKDSLCEP
jgi:magnesium-transporting ATPase (P-type)